MATLKQDLLRSTFQENQMRLLQSIEENVDKMENRQRTIEDIISDDLSDVIIELRDIGTSIRNFPSPRSTNDNTNHTGSTRENTGDTLSDINRRVGNIDRNIRGSHREDIDSREEQTNRLRRDLDRGNRDNTSRSRDLQRILKVAFDTIYSLLDSIGLSVRSLINNSGRVLQDTNSIIKNTGYSITTVRDFRTNLKDTVDSLNQYYENSELGKNPFNYNDALDLFTTIMNNSGITNMDFYDTYGEMFLKTAKSMNVNLSSLATFSDQFYKRYSFSSQNMEDLLSSIRGNTAGTSLSDEELLQLVNENQLSIASYADSMAQGNQELFDKYLSQGAQQLESAASYLDSLGLDKGQREQIINDLMKASTDISSDEAKRYMILSGKDPGDIMSEFFTDYKSVLEPYIKGYAQAGTELLSDYNMSDLIASNFGYDPKLAKQLSISSRYSTQYQSAKEYEENRDSKVSEDPIMDLWVGYQESMTNKFSTLNEDLAKWQEDTGIDLSFIEQIFNLLKPVLSTLTGLGLGNFLRSLILGTSTSGLLGSLGNAGSGLLGTAGPIALAIAGIGTAVYGISEALKQREQENKREYDSITGYEDIELDAGQTYGYGVTGEDGSKGTIATDNPIDYSYYEDLLADFQSKTESRTGLKTLDPNGGYQFGTRLENVGRSLLGPGWWKEDAHLYDYAPIIGGLVNTVSWREDEDNLMGLSGGHNSNAEKARDYDDFYTFLNTAKTDHDLEVLFNFYKTSGLLDDGNSAQLGVFSRSYDILYKGLINNNSIVDLQGLLDGQSPDRYWRNLDTLNLSNPYTEINPESSSTGDKYRNADDAFEPVDANSYDIGAEKLLQDQLALVHEGEAIIPSAYNPFDEEKYQRLFNPEIILDSSIIDRSRDTLPSDKDIFEYYIDKGTAILENLYTDRFDMTHNASDAQDYMNMYSGYALDQNDNVVPESSDDTTDIVYTKGEDTPDILAAIERYKPEIPKEYSAQRDSDHRDIMSNLSEVLKSMNTIYRFLSKWKEDNYIREDLASVSGNKGGSSLGGGGSVDVSTLFGQTESEEGTVG